MQMLSGASLRKAFTWNAFIVLSLLSAEVFATPSITGVSTAGGLVNGASLTITGSGFGTKSPAAPYLWADFSNGSIEPSNLGQQTQWTQIQNMVYSATGGPNNGPYAAGIPLNLTGSGSDDAWALAIDAKGFTWNDLSARYYVFKKSFRNFDVENYLGTGAQLNWKPFRIWNLNSSGNLAYPDWAEGSFNGNYESEGISAYGTTEVSPYAAVNGVPTNPALVAGPVSQWFSEENIWQVNSTTTSNDGLYWWYVNNQLVGQLPVNMGWTTYHFIMRDDSTSNGSMIRLYAQGVAANAPSFPLTNAFGMDDIYVDNTWSRVMIGNASTWAASMVHDVEIPTAWSDGSVSVILHNDSLPSFDGAYLYVFDSNGNVNPDGYPLCGSCPQPPANLTAN